MPNESHSRSCARARAQEEAPRRRLTAAALWLGSALVAACSGAPADGDFEALELGTARQAFTTSSFPSGLLADHHAWHRSGRNPNASGQGEEFLDFHLSYMQGALDWYASQPGFNPESFGQWHAIFGELRAGMDDGLRAAERRVVQESGVRIHG